MKPIKKYKKKDLDIAAYQFQPGDSDHPEWLSKAISKGRVEIHSDHALVWVGQEEEPQRVEAGDWFVMDSKDDYFASPDRLFSHFYEEKL